MIQYLSRHPGSPASGQRSHLPSLAANRTYKRLRRDLAPIRSSDLEAEKRDIGICACACDGVAAGNLVVRVVVGELARVGVGEVASLALCHVGGASRGGGNSEEGKEGDEGCHGCGERHDPGGCWSILLGFWKGESEKWMMVIWRGDEVMWCCLYRGFSTREAELRCHQSQQVSDVIVNECSTLRALVISVPPLFYTFLGHRSSSTRWPMSALQRASDTFSIPQRRTRTRVEIHHTSMRISSYYTEVTEVLADSVEQASSNQAFQAHSLMEGSRHWKGLQRLVTTKH